MVKDFIKGLFSKDSHGAFGARKRNYTDLELSGLEFQWPIRFRKEKQTDTESGQDQPPPAHSPSPAGANIGKKMMREETYTIETGLQFAPAAVSSTPVTLSLSIPADTFALTAVPPPFSETIHLNVRLWVYATSRHLSVRMHSFFRHYDDIGIFRGRSGGKGIFGNFQSF